MKTWVLLLLLFIAAVNGAASQPVRFNYQAKLTDSDGIPLEGPQSCTFWIYEGGTAGVANSGTLKYQETASVEGVSGVVNHAVGTGTPVGDALSSAVFETSADLFLQVAIGVESNVVLPRTRLESVPFAINAQSAGNGIAPGFLTLGMTSTPPTGFSATGLIVHGTWVEHGDYTDGIMLSAAAAAAGKVYVVGGYWDGSTLGANNQYDPLTDLWLGRASLSSARYLLTCTELGGLIYAVGGFTQGPTYFPNNDVYNPGTNSWTARQGLTVARYAHVAGAVNGKLYVAAGENAPFTLTPTTEEYDPNTNLWTMKADIPTTRVYAASAALDGRLHVIGGRQGGNYLDTHEVYDPSLNNWTTRAPLPLQVASATAIAAGGKIYLFGGQTASTTAVGNTWVYDYATDTWSFGPPMVRERSGHTAAFIAGRMYAFGGYDNEIVEGSITPVECPGSLNAGQFHLFVKE